MKKRLGDLRHHLKTRGYNYKVIESGFSKASAIDRNDLLECLAMEHLCVLQLETTLATLVTTWLTLADRRWRSRHRSSDQYVLNAFRSPELYNGWFREQLVIYTLNPQTNINTFHPVVTILSNVLRVSHSAKPLG
jgi:hypothetical protein